MLVWIYGDILLTAPVIFQYAEMLNLPDGVLDLVDEFSEAREEGLENEISCDQLYDSCPSESLVHIRRKIKNLLQWVRRQIEAL